VHGAGSAPCVSNYAGSIGLTRQPSGLFKKIQVSNRFTHRKHCLVCIERPLKQDIEQLGRALWRNPTSLLQHTQPFFMVCM
jgi:hypothetical protein